MNLIDLIQPFSEQIMPIAVLCHAEPPFNLGFKAGKRYEIGYISREKGTVSIENGRGLGYNYTLKPDQNGLSYLNWFRPLYE